MPEDLWPGTPPKDGYFFELTAVRKFIFVDRGKEILVKPGIDIATHVNILSSNPY
jgi:hypothetical protein